MLYLIHGEDFKKARENLNKLTEALLKRKPDSNLFRLDAETFSKEKLEGFIGGQGLFEQKYIVILDKCLENKDHATEIFDEIKNIGESENIFICIEESIDKKSLSKLEKKAEKVYEYSFKIKEPKSDFKLFTLTDALGEKNRKKAWVEYRKAITNGTSPEEIHSMLIWQVRSMVIASSSKSPSESGLKPFVYSKANRYAQNYKDEGVNNLYKALVEIYHEARRGGVDLSDATEALLLSI